jgi:dihydroorotate dehydrogenase|tara:strand:+ start:51 stop:764 length:714 start_codon:yes stop_codon:yes gene_type:complete
MFFINPPFSNYLNLPNTMSIKGSYTLDKREGLFLQIIKTLRYSFENGGWTNKIGLRNPGIDYAIKNYKKGSHIVSIAILNKNEIPEILKRIPTDMDIELNVSCPNAENKMCTDGLNNFINSTRDWCIIKLSPTCDTKLIDDYYKQGFRQFHCSNTIPIKEGGLSGKSIIPYSNNLIKYINTNYKDTEIIGGGGITKIGDMNNYRLVGANHFSASTVFFCPYLSSRLYLDYLNYIKNK